MRLRELFKQTEDRHPNDEPYGPEFKPTMPAGTVRVDVSDVYDWYKLGMHVANLKGLGKHDFGKGPPSTIMAFGSEDEEHKYIQDLKKLGLDTTDIDPKDLKQPKGMMRQKTDPTYNVETVSEALLVTDVPNEDWLDGKIEYARKKGYDSYNSPYMGSTTGYVRQPSRVEIPIDILKRIPGARKEQENVRRADLEAIMKIMDETGKLPMHNGKEYAPFIGVAWNGDARVLEGNHRIMAAAKLGWKSLPVELKYFDGGERVESGMLYPGKIGLKEPEPGTTIVMNQD